MSRLVEATRKVSGGAALSRAEAEAAMEELLSGRASDDEIAGLLAALRAKGATVEELVGFARAIRRHAEPIFADGRRPPGILLDTCGTGGGSGRTFNISTAAAFVVAGAGVRVAKHGNRSFSSACGAADVMEALGVKLELSPLRVGACIEQVGIGFLFAPAVHTAMKHAMAARRRLGGQTVFNLLGPLTNPAGASAQLLGVFDRGAVDLLANALRELGAERAFVVHGSDGLDEISISAETSVAEVRDAAVRRYTITPEDFGLARAPLESLRGGDAAENAGLLRRILGSEAGPPRDVVLANAAAALVAAGLAAEFREGMRLAAESIDSGAARGKLDALAAFTRS